MSLGRRLRSMLHTRPGQLAARLRMLLVRRVLEQLGRDPRIPSRMPPPLAQAAPAPVFLPGRHRARLTPEGWAYEALGRTWLIHAGMDWRPVELRRGTRLELLHLHYMEYLEALPDEIFKELILDWISRNNNLGTGFWMDHWNSYALSIRVAVWMQEAARRRLLEEGDFTLLFLDALTRQLRFLQRHLELDIRGNHVLKNIKALLWASRFFKGPEAESWGRLGSSLLLPELEEQVLLDGLHFERSPAYHLQAFADLLECFASLPDGPVRKMLGQKLDLMAQTAVDLTHPDGCPSLFNDGGLHMATPLAECLSAYQRLRGPSPRPRPVWSMEHAGYFGVREKDSLVIWDCGPIAPDTLPAHGHGDLLAFEWTIQGQRLITDTGVYEYHEGPRRARSRSTAAHNTVTLDGLDQCEFWLSFRMGHRAQATLHAFEALPDGFKAEGSHNGYTHLPGKPIHRRSFHATPNRIQVEDCIAGGAGQRAEARLLLHPKVVLHREGEVWFLAREGARAMLRSLHLIRVEKAPWYPDFGVEVTTQQLVLDYGTAPCDGRFLLEAL